MLPQKSIFDLYLFIYCQIFTMLSSQSWISVSYTQNSYEPSRIQHILIGVLISTPNNMNVWILSWIINYWLLKIDLIIYVIDYLYRTEYKMDEIVLQEEDHFARNGTFVLWEA